ncbi:MAG: hypothetical protein QNK37_13280 [Acidobacteriota bacterium]|nr:hypothetical protein [Acidobacteriota bacterium]
MILLLLLAFQADASPISISRDNLLQVATDAYDRGPGRAYKAQIHGLEQAGDLVGGRFDQVGVSLLPEINRQNGQRGEHNFQVEASMSLADLPELKRDLLQNEISVADRASLNERLKFMSAVQQAFAEAALAEVLVHHVRELYNQADRQRQDLAVQVERQLALRSDLLAWSALAGRYAGEIREMEHRRQTARDQLSRLLGARVELNLPRELPEALAENPFTALSQKPELFPQVLLAADQARSAQSEASLAAGMNALELAPNINVRDEPNGSWLGLGVKLSFSLRPKKDATWRKHKARAESFEARSRWEAASQAAELKARAAAYERNAAHAASFKKEVLTPLIQQAELYERALEGGHVERRFQLQVQADLHEAEHEYLELIHQLWTDRLEAEIYTYLIRTEGRP